MKTMNEKEGKCKEDIYILTTDRDFLFFIQRKSFLEFLKIFKLPFSIRAVNVDHVVRKKAQ